jgi:hypothetical protein
MAFGAIDTASAGLVRTGGRLVAALVLASALLSTASTPSGAAGTPGAQLAPAACTPAWRYGHSPNTGWGDNALAAIDVLSSTDIWAVGNSLAGDVRSTLVEHFNGSRWSVVPSPNGPQPINWLTGVSAVAADDVWAVGFTNDGNGFESQSFTLILHYDGTSWQVVTSPNPVPDPNPGDYAPSNELYGVHAISATDVWAVGHTFTVTLEQTLALHWDGIQWSNVPTPHPSRYSRLRSVDAAAPGDVWAVGEITKQGTQRTLAQHFDGAAWHTVASPNASPTVDYLTSVSMAAPDDVWAVGYHIEVLDVADGNQPYQTSSLHYDGTAWTLVDAPDVNQENNYLRGVVAIPGKSVWAVGFWDTGAQLRTLAERWTGSAWIIVSSPNRSDVVDELIAIDSAPNALWSVGDFFGAISYRTEIQRFSC